MSADWPEPEQGVLLNVVSSLPLEGFGCPSSQLRSWEQVFFGVCSCPLLEDAQIEK